MKQKRYGLILLPSTAPNSYGISIGSLGSEVWCGMPYYKKSHGINIQLIGQGALWMFCSLNTFQYMKEDIETPESLDSLKNTII